MTIAPDIDQTPALESAGFWMRAGARLVDWIVQALVGGMVAFVLAILAFLVESFSGRSTASMLAAMERTTFIGWIGSTFAALAYHTFSEGFSGTTVGKRLLNLQVIGVNRLPITFAQGLKRSVAFLVDALFFGMVAAHFMNESAEKQRIGDQWAETRVVRRRSLSSPMRTPTTRMLGAFVVAILITCIFTALTQLAEYLWLLRGA